MESMKSEKLPGNWDLKSKIKILKIRPEYLIIIVAALIKLLLYQLALLNSGFTGDELLHIDAGNHLAPGYMDFPPMIGIIAWVQNLFNSDSMFIHHLFLSIAGTLVLVFSALITMKLGGNSLAVLICSLCFIFSPGFNGNHFSPTIFEGLFWVICTYFIVLYCNRSEGRYFYMIALFAALGFLSKYSIVFLFSGLFLSVLLFQRSIFRSRHFWLALLLFLLIISPNIWWQYNNGFPVVRHMSELYDTQLNQISIIGEIKTLITFLNPAVFLLVLPAIIIIPFHPHYRKYRLLSFTLLFALIILILAKGKFYYYFLIIGGVIPFASVYFVNLLKGQKWVLYSFMGILSAFGIWLVPHMLPVLKLEKYISIYGLEQNEHGKIPLPYANYYSSIIWPQLLHTINETFNSLTESEQENCLIWGRHYSYAGGVNLLGKKYGLPEAFSFHSSYFVWVPEFSKDMTIIAIGESDWTRQHYEHYFEEVEQVGQIENPYATSPSWYSNNIYLCKKLKYNSAELKDLFKDEIY